jgi:HPt (histidine-containing phosphotransfer) domain-containing protein
MFLDNGFCAFLPKPIEPARLEQILSRYGQFKIKSDFEREIESFAGQGGDEFLPREIQGIDMEYALSRFAGQRKTLRKVLESFVSHIPTALQRLQDAFAKGEGELALYAITAHGIKGSARAIGATDLGNFAEELEIASKSGNWQEVQVKHPKFVQMCEELLLAFRKTLGKPTGTLSAGTDAPPVSHLLEPSPALLAEILDAARNFNTQVFKAKLAELESHSYEKDQDLADWICEQGHNLEYELVAKKLESKLEGVGHAAEQ